MPREPVKAAQTARPDYVMGAYSHTVYADAAEPANALLRRRVRQQRLGLVLAAAVIVVLGVLLLRR